MTPEVIVIGAGPAGSIAAADLATRGRSVLLLDGATFPREKVCGCCLSSRGVATLGSLGLHDLLATGTPLETVALGIHGRIWPLSFPGSRVLSRGVLDQGLLDHARACGVSFRPRCRGTVATDGVVSLRTGDGFERMRPKLVIVADGLDGRALRDHPAFTWDKSPTTRFGAGTITEPDAPGPAPGVLEMLVDTDGYLGIVRLPDGRLDLAAALDVGGARSRGGPGRLAAEILIRHDRRDLAAMMEKATWSATPPLTRQRTVASGNIACVGDAAGYVEPFTGEGMTWAMRCALALAEIADSAVESGRLEPWIAEHRRITRLDRLRCRAVSLAMRRPRLVTPALACLSRLPFLRRHLSTVASGDGMTVLQSNREHAHVGS